MAVDRLTLYRNESTGLTGPESDRCKEQEIKKRMDHFLKNKEAYVTTILFSDRVQLSYSKV